MGDGYRGLLIFASDYPQANNESLLIPRWNQSESKISFVRMIPSASPREIFTP